MFSTEPATLEDAKRVPQLPGYAPRKANVNVQAERLMQDPNFRAEHTSAGTEFIEDFYQNSRLHHLSTWKNELRTLVAEVQECAEKGFALGEGSTEGEVTATAMGMAMQER